MPWVIHYIPIAEFEKGLCFNSLKADVTSQNAALQPMPSKFLILVECHFFLHFSRKEDDYYESGARSSPRRPYKRPNRGKLQCLSVEESDFSDSGVHCNGLQLELMYLLPSTLKSL